MWTRGGQPPTSNPVAPPESVAGVCFAAFILQLHAAEEHLHTIWLVATSALCPCLTTAFSAGSDDVRSDMLVDLDEFVEICKMEVQRYKKVQSGMCTLL